MDVRLPDGTVVTNVPEGTTQADLMARVGKMRPQEPQAEPRKDEGLMKSMVGGAIEPLLHLGTGAVAAPLAGLSGIAGSVLPGPAGQGEKWTKSVGGAMTYEPRTQGGKDATDVITYPLQKYGELSDFAGGKTTDATGSPALGATVNTAMQAVPMLIGARSAPKTGAVSERVAAALQEQRNRAEVRDATLSEGMEQGLKVPPSVVNPSAVNKVVESIAGKAALRQEIQQRNQPGVNTIANEELGLPKDTALTPDKLDAYRAAKAKPYEEIGNLSPTAKSALEEMKKTRFDANLEWKSYNRSGDTKVRQRAMELSQEADTYHQIIIDEATKAGRKDLIPDLAESRKKIAQSYQIQDGLNRGNADISAPSMGAALERGDKLSGGLETIAKFQQAMAPYMGEAAGVTTPGVSALGPIASVGMGMGGASMGAGGWLAGGYPLLGGPARSLALSETYQRAMAQPKHGRLNRIPTTRELMIEEIMRRRNQALAAGAVATGEQQ